MIRVCDVWHHYGVRPVLKDVSFHIECGQLVAVVVPNGLICLTALSCRSTAPVGFFYARM